MKKHIKIPVCRFEAACRNNLHQPPMSSGMLNPNGPEIYCGVDAEVVLA